MIRGLVTAEITGADIPGTLRSLTDRGITLLCTVPKGDLTLQVTIERRDYAQFIGICRKRGDSIRITGRLGPYWKLKGLMARPILLMGMLLILFGTLYVPSRVLFVHVEGNHRVPARKILEMAEGCGIGFGASRRAVRSERMKNALLEAVPELQWAGVNTNGCVAVITVRERTESDNSPEKSEFGHIVALRDGVVTQCTATRGTLLCAPGQAVTEGQILISGYTDTGLAIRAEQASGEVYGQTHRRLRVITPQFSGFQRKIGEEKEKISLLIGKKRINLWKDSGISDTTCDRMYEEYYITLPGGLILPLALVVERYAVVECAQREVPREDTEILLVNFGENYMRQIMIAGNIRSSVHTITQRPGIMILAGEYRCTELIGVVQRLQIGEENGEKY